MVSDGNIVNTWKLNGWFNFQGGFYHIFRHEFLILKSKLRDLNSRLGGCEICVSKIYFSNFLENNEGKRLKWPSAWFCDSSKGSGATPYGAQVLPHHIWLRFRGLSTSQPRSNQKYLKDYSMYLKEDPEDVLTTWSTRRRPAKYSTPTGLGYEELGGLLDQGQQDCLLA